MSLKLFQNKKFLNIHPIQSHLNRKNINANIVKISPCSGKKTELSPKVALKKACIQDDLFQCPPNSYSWLCHLILFTLTGYNSSVIFSATWLWKSLPSSSAPRCCFSLGFWALPCALDLWNWPFLQGNMTHITFWLTSFQFSRILPFNPSSSSNSGPYSLFSQHHWTFSLGSTSSLLRVGIKP